MLWIWCSCIVDMVNERFIFGLLAVIIYAVIWNEWFERSRIHFVVVSHCNMWMTMIRVWRKVFIDMVKRDENGTWRKDWSFNSYFPNSLTVWWKHCLPVILWQVIYLFHTQIVNFWRWAWNWSNVVFVLVLWLVRQLLFCVYSCVDLNDDKFHANSEIGGRQI